MKQLKNNINSYLLVFAICLMAFIFNGDYLAVNLAMKPISQEFQSSLNVIQWILSGYMLAWALLVIPAGKLLDSYSSKTVSIIGIGLFLFASIGGGLAINSWSIVLARMIQGASAAIFVPTIYSIIFRHFPQEKQGQIMGIIGLAVGIGLALGPMMGGFLIAFLGWRSIFFINIPIGIVAIMIIIVADKKEISPNTNAQKISKRSILLLSTSIISLLSLLSDQNRAQNLSIDTLLGIFSFFSFIAFAIIQKKITNPLLSPTLFSNKSFLGCCIGIFIMEYAFASTLIGAALYLQNYLNLSVLDSSFIFLWITLIFGIMAVVGGRWTDKAETRIPVVFGLLVVALAGYIFSYLAPLRNLQWMGILFLMMGLGSGISYAALNAGLLKTVSSEEIGTASGVFLMITLLGNALGVTISAMIYDNSEPLISLVRVMNGTGLISFIAAIFCFKLMKIKCFDKSPMLGV